MDLLINTLGDYIPYFGLYAELHYRFKFTGSRYYKKEPEIIADVPHRIDPGEDIPVLILIKDSHQFPIVLNNIAFSIIQNGKTITIIKVEYNLTLKNSWWEETQLLKRSKLSGEIEVRVIFNYSVNGLRKTVENHNYPLANNFPLQTFLSKESLPGSERIKYGDLHYHSNLTEDIVEFGAPMEATLLAAKAIGLSFYCNTDHSYDLDDKPGSWKETDPELRKWKKSRKDIVKINKKYNSTFILPSEELTLHNQDGRNIHALILNNKEFLPGQGDSAEQPFNFKSKFNTKSVQNSLSSESLYIAAHPITPVPFLQWLFVKRGMWREKDLKMNKLAGMQILNGALDSAFYQGLKVWITLLLKGERKFIYGGSDAHGNFNLFRQIKTPMISLWEKKEQIFGECRTGVFASGPGNISSVIDAMRAGNCFITNGPMVNIQITTDGSLINMGSVLTGKSGQLNIEVISTKEFGKIEDIEIIEGLIGDKRERILYHESNTGSLQYFKTIVIKSQQYSYYRCSVKTSDKNGISKIALSNPIWVNPEGV